MPEIISDDFPSKYDPKPVEAKWYKFWEDSGFLHADATSPKPKFSIVIPPPNVTGSLHMGHALDNTLPDMLIRQKKMQGFETLWLPGMDHAGIGTQVKVERMLAKEGKTRFDIGREEFLKRAWEWKERYGGEITGQLRRLGCLLDWPRSRFTMDEVLSRAVREAFVRYYEKGLIYRGLRIVNWCPRCGTAVSDLEVKFKDENAHLWYIRYPVIGENPKSQATSPNWLVVATTRPETMLGDTAVAVNPDDERFRALVGRMLLLPLTDRKIPVIADAAVETGFGTGAVKVTPAHDPVDFEIGERHKLARPKVIGDDARMTDEAPAKYRGMTRDECRKAVVEDLEAAGLLEKIEDYKHAVGTCDRCETVIEPLASMQWWVRMAPLAEPAIKVVEEGRVKFNPERWNRVYLEWMKNIRDWCISRQLWWGHRIPVWYCECGELIVARKDPTECPKCHSKNLRQDEDVLDTWFSSALWPFSTMGWPNEDASDYRKFFPTDFLTTDPDIIFRWEARMIFSALEFTGKVPFDNVYIHSTVLDKSGARMSRSKGIGVDPLVIFDEYGTDAARFVICYLESQSQSYRLWNERFDLGRNFCNKIWNACRFVAPHISDASRMTPEASRPTGTAADHWIRARFNVVLEKVNDGMARFTFSQVASALYDFFWHDLCDWYLEFAKARLKSDDPAVRRTLYDVIRGTLQLLHPIMPYITEELWQKLGFGSGAGDSILRSTWPVAMAVDESDSARVETLRELIVAVRNIRAEMEVPAKTVVDCIINTSDEPLAAFLRSNEELARDLSRVSGFRFEAGRPAQSSIAVLSGLEAYVPLGGVVDVDKEIGRIKDEIATLGKLIAGVDAKFANPNFAARAKPEVVESERARRAELVSKRERLERQLEGWK